MVDQVKLKKSIIIGGLVYMHEKIVDRRILRGTRFDSPEFVIEPSDPLFDEEAPDQLDVVSQEVNIEEDGVPVDEEEIVKIPVPKRKKLVRR